MKFSVLIINCNYGRYLRECVESVLGQTYPAHEIIVVDDGSTDDSLHVLSKHSGDNPRVKVISQINLGQTEAMARGVDAVTGDIVCLLDADDQYKPEYLATLKTHYTEFPKTDLTFCRYETFGAKTDLENKAIWLDPQRDYDYGYTALLTYFGNVPWIGNVTSTVALRMRLARTLNLHEVARTFYLSTSADYSILLGASLLGGRKYYLHRTLIDYRIHDENYFTKRISTPAGRHLFHYHDLVRYEYFKRRSCISEQLFRELEIEARSVPNPDPAHLESYRKIQNSKASLEKVSWLSELERKLRNVRKGLLKKKS